MANGSPPSTIEEAVRTTVSAGDTVYLGNFGAQLYVVGQELIRQRYHDLHVIAGSGGLMLDQLIGSGVVHAATFAHCWNPIGPAPAYNLRRAAEAGDPQVEIRELSLGVLNAAMQAAAWGVPFLPVAMSPETGYVTDGWSRGMIAMVDSEFGSTLAVKALRPDVAFIYADHADRWGNAVLTAPYGEHLAAATAAARTVVVAEEVTDSGQQLALPATLAGVHVDTVVRHERAVWPDGAAGRYPRDIDEYRRYATASSSADGFATWLDSLRGVS
ncbi:MAG TPA: CoA-transferase [Jatrophihabitantaceae bacterium]|jgi:glutaconate CoA-transferase subunit A|nr:CoA-transferase [Jatrophihabitantaceae bacterium]